MQNIRNKCYYTHIFPICQALFSLNLKYIPFSFDFFANLSLFLIFLKFISFYEHLDNIIVLGYNKNQKSNLKRYP